VASWRVSRSRVDHVLNGIDRTQLPFAGKAAGYIAYQMSHHSIELWTFIVTTIGVVVGLAALFAGWLTIRDNAKTAKAAFWIMLRNLFTSYDDIHANFRPTGLWAVGEIGPPTPLDKGRTELYMGLFEYCDILLEEGLLDYHTFKESYAYRLRNLVTNKWVIQAKLIQHRQSWLAFINLCYRLGVPIADVPPLTAEEYSTRYPKGKEKR
jgi:hypothetical protein